MPKLALYVPLKARPGKESDVADFLTSALALVQAEPGTLTAYSDDAGRVFRREAGQAFQFDAGHCSDLKPDAARCLWV